MVAKSKFVFYISNLKEYIISILLLLFMLAPHAGQAQIGTSRITQPSNALAQHGTVHDRSCALFIENKGQWPSKVNFLYRVGGLDLWITKNGVVYDLHKDEYAKADTDGRKNASMSQLSRQGLPRPVTRKGHVVSMTFANQITTSSAIGDRQQPGISNYFIGNDSTKWMTNVHSYANALVQNIYDGVDARFYSDSGRPRYDIIVHPGADPAEIAMDFAGQDMLCRNDSCLTLQTSVGELEQCGLFAYQIINGEKQKIVCRFRTAENGRIGFYVGQYDRTIPLVIDPLIYSTYLGGSESNSAINGIALDRSGNAYVTGQTDATDYPITLGAYQRNNGGVVDAFVSKLSSDGSTLIYSTYIGGSDLDFGSGIAVDGSGNAFMTGATLSNNYPVTPGAFLSASDGQEYVVISKLNSSGTALIYSTLIGVIMLLDLKVGAVFPITAGPAPIAIDSAGDAFIAGNLSDSSFVGLFPVTPGAYETSPTNAYITKLNPSGSGLVYSTFFAGSAALNGLALDSSGNVYVTGWTPTNSGPPTTIGAYQTKNAGISDIFVSKLNAKGSALVYSTLIGGPNDDNGYGIAVDDSGNAYISGQCSTGYPTTPGAYQTTQMGAVTVSKLNPSGTNLIYSTYIGGDMNGRASAIAIDSFGNAYITGWTASVSGGIPNEYPITPDAFRTNNNGQEDVIVTKLNECGSALLYSTHFGGNYLNLGSSIAINNMGDIYIAGSFVGAGDTMNYPTTPGAYQTQALDTSYNLDGFVTKFSIPEIPTVIDSFPPVCSYGTTTIHLYNQYCYAITVDSAEIPVPFGINPTQLPASVAASDSLMLNLSISPESAGAVLDTLHVFYHSPYYEHQESVMQVIASTILGIRIKFGMILTRVPMDSNEFILQIYFDSVIDSATANLLALQSFAITVHLNTDLLSPTGVLAGGDKGVQVSQPTIGQDSVSFNLKLPSSDYLADSDNHPVSIALTRYSTDSLSTQIILTSASLSSGSSGFCYELSMPSPITFSDPRCGDPEIAEALSHQPPFAIESLDPNPTTGNLQIVVSKVLQSLTIGYEILDILGATVQSGALPGDHLNMSGLPSGSYYLRLNASGFVETRNVIVSR